MCDSSNVCVYILKVKEVNTTDSKHKGPHASPSALLFSPEVAGDNLLCMALVT